ncbi:MAG: hypothetical protein HC900_09095 [Methylacidiphilales bacterium]|nr:hypothetical protein [Candidatus Methylacidiphilales bacterium]
MFLIVLGAILAVSGLAAIVGGLPFLAVGFDNTLILSGTVGLTGGLLAVGLGSILAALDDLGSRIDQFARPTTATLKAAARPGSRLPAPPRPTPVSAQMPAAEYSPPPEIPAAGPVPEAPW